MTIKITEYQKKLILLSIEYRLKNSSFDDFWHKRLNLIIEELRISNLSPYLIKKQRSDIAGCIREVIDDDSMEIGFDKEVNDLMITMKCN